MNRRIAGAFLLLACAPPVSMAAARGGETVDAEVRVTAARRVPDGRIADLRREIRVALASNECGLKLRRAGEGKPGAPAAGVLAELHIDAWREVREPGGRPVFDPTTGGDRPGWEILNEIRYRLTIRVPGREKPLYDRERRFAARVGTMPVPSFDPARESRKRAVAWVLRDLERRLCRAARAARRSVR